MMLFIFVVVVGTPELVGEYIECWCPSSFEESQVYYVNYMCWISNTYYIPMTRPIPMSYEARYSNKIYYYQWTPLIFLVMAFLFKTPRMVWKYLSNKCGVGIKKLMTTAKETQSEMIYNLRRTYQINLFNAGLPQIEQTEFFPPDTDIEVERQKTLKWLAKYIDHWCLNATSDRAGLFCNVRRRGQELFDFGCGRHHGNFLISLLLLVRFLYLVNVICQLILLNEFLTDDFYVYGYQVIQNFFAGKDWSLNHARFPRVTLCDFDIRQLSNIQRFTLQCVLPINLYNEKIFIALWFWLTILAVITLLNFAFTIFVALYPIARENFILKYLKVNDIYRENDRKFDKMFNIFVYSHLKHDGVFVLRMVSENVGSAITSDFIRYLWEEFEERFQNGKKDFDDWSNSSVTDNSNNDKPKCAQSQGFKLTFRNNHRSSKNGIASNRSIQSSFSSDRSRDISNQFSGKAAIRDDSSKALQSFCMKTPESIKTPRVSYVSFSGDGYTVSMNKKQMAPYETAI